MRTDRTLAHRFVAWVVDLRMAVVCLAGLAVFAGLLVAPFDVPGLDDRAPVPVDAIPDIGENQQIVFTEWPGRSPQDIDDQITYPLTVALLGLPEVKTIRSTSAFGFSTIYVIFEDDAEFYWTRSRVAERLASLPRHTLPTGVTPQLGPDATALGQVFWYTLEGRDADGEPAGGWDLHELRTIQDYQVRYALAAADGVAEVASVGGFVREYQIDVDPDALRAWGVRLADVYGAVAAANAEVGARTTEINGVEYLIRGVGFLRDVDDLRQTVVASIDGTPVRVSDVAHVQVGPSLRRGALDRGGSEAVGGVVVARYGANPLEVIHNVRDAIDGVQQALPTRTLDDGRTSQVTIVPFYDRAALIDRTVGTLEDALTQQILVTVLVVLLLLVHVRSSALIAGLLPIAVLVSFVAMKAFGIAANVVSLAGIAIAIGTMVDIGIVIIENIVQRLDEADPEDDPKQVVVDATAEVAGAVLTAVATTVVSFLPVFLLEGPEAKLFVPLAWTKTFAIVASVILALTLLPALASWVLPDRRIRRVLRVVRWPALIALAIASTVVLAAAWSPMGVGAGSGHNIAFVAIVVGGLLLTFHGFRWAYRPLLRFALAYKPLFLALPLAIVGAGLSVWLGFGTVFGWLPDRVHTSETGQWLHHALPGLDSEFMPQLDEGAFLYMPTTMPHASIGETLDLMAQLDLQIESVPEVRFAVGKLGRAESALDPAPVSMIETIIEYVPEYRIDDRGRPLRFAVDDDGDFVRDDDGELVPDPGGQPYRNWRPEIETEQDIWDEIVAVANVPGLTSAPLLQPISARIVMLQSGIRAPMAVRLSGPDLDDLGRASVAVEAILREQPLVNTDAVNADRPVGKPWIEIHPDRDALARFGVTIRQVQDIIEIAIGGRTITETVEGRERYPVRVRYPRELRDHPDRMADILVDTASGAPVPLGDLAEIHYVRGPQMIRSEDGRLVAYVMFDRAPGVGEVEAVESVRMALDRAVERGELTLPDGVSFDFAGSYENAVRARARLAMVVPIALLTIFALLYLQFRSTLTSLMVFSGVAVALAGGFVLIGAWSLPGFLDVELLGASLRDVFGPSPMNLSVAVWVGFIALFGIATDDGVVMATYLTSQFADGPATSVAEVRDRVVDAGSRRVRPCLMTTATTILALLPVLTSRGTGADVMVPMAIPAVGGMAIELITLFVVPVLYSFTEETRVRLRSLRSSP